MSEFIGVMLAIGILIGFFFLGVFAGNNQAHKEAVTVGVAEWYLDANADKAFRWKTNHFEK